MSKRNTGPTPARRTRWWGRLAMFVATCCAFSVGLMAQVGFSTFSQSLGTYTPITGTQLSANMTASSGNGSLDAVSTAFTFPDGFSFTFNGTAYTGCRASTDGNITFGATTTNSSSPLSAATAWNGVVSAFSRDLQGGYVFTSNRTSGSNVITVVSGGFDGITVGSVIFGTGIPAGATVTAVDAGAGTVTISANATSNATGVYAWVWNGRINYELLGTAPNRTLVVQWSNFKPWGQTLTTVNGFLLNFQIRLNETDNSIEVVYGNCSPGVGVTSTTTAQVGLRGANNTFPTNVTNRSVTKGVNDWTTSAAGTTNASACVFNTVAPANVIPSGLTFRWDTPPALNISAGAVIRTGTGCYGASEALTARIQNAGTSTIDLTTNPVGVSVSISGAGSGTLTGTANTGTLASGATLDVPLTPNADMSVTGTYTFASTVTMTGDGNATDNTSNTQILNPAAALPQNVTFAGFDGANLGTISPGWYEATGLTLPTGTTSGMIQSDAAQEAAFGTRTARYNMYNGNGDYFWFVSPRTAQLSATSIFSFKVAATEWNGTGNDPDFMNAGTVRDDVIIIRISTNCGASFVDEFTLPLHPASGISSALSAFTVDLSGYAGQNVIAALFINEGADDVPDYDLHVDDLYIGDAPTCLVPTGLGSSNLSPTSVDISFTCGSCGGNYIIEYGVAPFTTPGSGATAGSGGTVVNATTSPWTIGTLAANTAYQFYVREDCGGSGFSINAGPFNVTTPCNAVTAPFVQNFDGTTTGTTPPACWANAGPGELWQFQVSGGSGPDYGVLASADHTTGSGRFAWIDGSSNILTNALVTPLIDISGLTQPEVSFWRRSNNVDQPATQNPLRLEAWDGTAWILLNTYSGNNPAWVQHTEYPVGLPGVTQFRLVCTPSPTGDQFYNDILVDDFSVIEAPVCITPNGLTASPNGTGTIVASWTAQPSATGGYNWEVRTSGAPGTAGAIASGNSPTTNFTTSSGILPNTTYQVYVQSDCDGDGVSAWSPAVTVFTGYCTTTVTNQDDEIWRVQFANVDHLPEEGGTGWGAAGYQDHSAVIGYVETGVAIPFSITKSVFYDGDQLGIWVDLNNDLDFDDAGEQLYTGPHTANPLTGNITIPNGTSGGAHRMRIRAVYTGALPACGNTAYGEVEDYTVWVCGIEATAEVVQDCGTEDEYMITFTAGNSSTGTVEYSVNGGAVQTVPYVGVGTSIGPFAETANVAVSVVDGGCTAEIGVFTSLCPIELDCGASPPMQMVHCYDNGDTRTWTWINPDPLGTVSLKFISGSVDPNDDILLWEGAVNGTPAVPPTLSNVLTGTVVNSTTNVLSMSINSDGSNSCADGGPGLDAGWVFQIRCGGCSEPFGELLTDVDFLGLPAEVDCEAVPATYNAYVIIYDNGIDSGTGDFASTVGYRLFVDDVQQPDVTGLPGMFDTYENNGLNNPYFLGTFPLGVEIDLVLLHEDQVGQSACNNPLVNDFTVGFNACPPANDQCATATMLTVNTLANCPANAVTGTTIGADQSGAQPSCATGPVQDVWYAVDITGWATPRLTITDGTSTVVGLELYNDCMTLQGYCTPDLTQFTFLNLNGLTPGVYYARVFTTVAGAGNFTICVSSPGPAGYECDGAIDIPSVPVTNQAVVCTTEPLPGLLNATTVPAACGGATADYKQGQEALYTYTASVTGDYTISYTGQTWTSIFVYSGACPTNGGTCVGSVGNSGGSKSIVVSMVAGQTYYIWFDTYPTPNSPCAGTFSISAPVVPCAGTPAPGNTLSSTALVCAGNPLELSLQNSFTESGISYAWEYSTDGGLNWLPIGGNTPTLSTTITVATEFRANVTCSNGPATGTSVPVLVGIETNPVNCYCIPVMSDGCTDDDVIARVQLNTLDNNTGVNCPSGLLGYSDYTGDPALTTTLQAGNSYNCTVTVGPWSEGIAVWIDFDDNGVFDHPEERVGFTNTTISAGASLTFPIAVACNPPLGTHRMRVRARFNTNGSVILPCEAGSYGETEDYVVTITAAVACPTPSGLAASNVLSTTADLTWNIGCAESQWLVEYGVTGFTLGTGTQVPVSGVPATGLTLDPSTTYQAYVRADCGVDGFSTWLGPISFTTLAPPPANDDCGGAIALTVNPNYLCAVVTNATTGGATASPQPDDATGTPNDDVWFSFVATNTNHRISLINRVWVSGGQANSTDMGMAVFLGPCDDGGMLEVAESDPEVLDLNSLTVGQTYYVRVYSWWSTVNHVNFDICIGTPPPPPANDDCAGAVALTVNAGLTCASQTAGTVQSATNSGVAVSPCLGTADDDVWYTFQATQASHIVSLNGVVGSVTDMNFQVFSGACGGLTSIACGATGPAPSTTVNGLSVGTVYYVRVYTNTATAGQNTTFNICVTTPPVGPPANDECAGAIAMTVNPGQACTAQTFGSVLNATGTLDATCAGGEDDDVWFSFVALGPTHTVSLNNVAGSVTSMNFQVLGGTCGSLSSIVCSTTGATANAIASGLTAGNTYYVRVYTNVATGGQNTTFNVCVTTPPVNDLCSTATAISCNSVVTSSTVGATNLGRPTTNCANSADPYENTAGPGVWYAVQGWGGPMTASLCGSSFDTQIWVGTTPDCVTLTCVAGNDDAGALCGANTTRSQVTWTSVAGTTYYVYVTSWGAAVSGDFVLTVSCGSTASVCPVNGLNLEFQNDANPGQVTWEVLNAAGNLTVLSGANPIPANAIGTQSICLPNGCYRLRVLDSAGDGMTTGGYILRNSGDGARIIDNKNNFSSGSVSAIANGGSFCLPIGTDKLIFSSCDKLEWVANKFIVAAENTAVSAQFGVTNTTSGYEFWFFDPNGSYSFRRFRSHATSDGFGTGALRANHFKINGWTNSVSTPHLPANVLLNVRIRGRVAGNNLEFGPACQFKIDAALAACPRVRLQDDPANTSDFSCGVFRNFGGVSNAQNRIYANPPQPVPTVASSSVRYQFRFRIPGEGVCIVRPPQTSAQMTLSWSAASGPQLQCSKTYEVDVRVSLDGGATWCFGPASSSQAAACADTEDWGKVCNVTINPCALPNGGGNSMVVEGNSNFTMYPNPNRGDQLFMNVSSVEEGVSTVSVDIFDLTGKRVMARTIAVQDGFINTNLELNGDLAGGLYVVSVTAGTKAYTERLVIQP